MWNPVLKNFIELKKQFIETYGKSRLWDYEEYKNCIDYWSSKFQYFKEMFDPLIITEYNDLVLLRYSLIDTDSDFWNKYDKMYRECRSVVIDKKNDCLALTPFRKFFNVNEIEETQEKEIRKRIEVARRIEISDKLDGSMQSARYYNQTYILAGSQALDPNMGFRVRLGYEMLKDNYKEMLKDYADFTHIFEFIHELDPHVVVYTKEQKGLYLIGMRNVSTGECLPYADVIKIAEKYGVKHTNVFDKTFDQLMNELDDKSSDEAEGFVIDIDSYKVKLKYNDYRKIHVMLSKVTSTNVIIKAIENGSYDDMISKVPSAYREDIECVANAVKNYVKKRKKHVEKMFNLCKTQYLNLNEIWDRKTFAMFVTNNYKDYLHYFMTLCDGKENNFLCTRSGRYIKYKEVLKWLEEND